MGPLPRARKGAVGRPSTSALLGIALLVVLPFLIFLAYVAFPPLALLLMFLTPIPHWVIFVIGFAAVSQRLGSRLGSAHPLGAPFSGAGVLIALMLSPNRWAFCHGPCDPGGTLARGQAFGWGGGEKSASLLHRSSRSLRANCCNIPITLKTLKDWSCLSCARPRLSRASWAAAPHHKIGMPRQVRRFSHCDAVGEGLCTVSLRVSHLAPHGLPRGFEVFHASFYRVFDILAQGFIE